MVDKAVTAVAKASYDRCCKTPDFLPAFYRNFFAACPEAAPRFANTNFERQAKLLQHAIGLLLVFPTQPRSEPPLLARVAERHSRRDLDIDPAFYHPFIESLIGTVKQYDGEWTPAIEVAWRETVAPGVQYMKSVH
jgi:hemoglobin-like flavoprotein